ncbi:MAG: Phenylacetic acid catabolic protein [Candidatus Promineifilaceae bacterium]|nr:Phenylacetic acid catabolic protein [Candidatus Promineifilaceae bacterium]
MRLTETEVRERLGHGMMIETIDHMSPTYLEGIKRILTVSADTELISAPAYYLAAQKAPSTNAYLSAIGIIQDELGHAHIAYRMLEDLGVSKEQLIYERRPEDFKYPYAFDVPLETWDELVVANALYDRAGFVLLSDVFKHTTFGPWKRALIKVDKEESFHLRHGETWMRKINEDPGGHRRLQQAVDWMFPLTVEWFGLPDEHKKHGVQIDYGFKGYTNDELRQIWMSTAVPFLNSLNIEVPARYDEQEDQYVLTFPFPSRFDAEGKRWIFEEGQISWDKVLDRWKGRGPNNQTFVGEIQRGYGELNNQEVGTRRWQEIMA